jgi:hypothetical protein
MDPTANLKEQRELAARILEIWDRGDHIDEVDASRLCELVEALDSWLMKGGHLPEDWERNRPKRRTENAGDVL